MVGLTDPRVRLCEGLSLPVLFFSRASQDSAQVMDVIFSPGRDTHCTFTWHRMAVPLHPATVPYVSPDEYGNRQSKSLTAPLTRIQSVALFGSGCAAKLPFWPPRLFRPLCPTPVPISPAIIIIIIPADI